MSVDITPSVTPSLTEQVAEEIRALIARRRVRQSHLARKLGVSEQWISVRLRGVQPIDLNDLQRIAEALDVAVVDLLPETASDRRTVTPLRPVELVDDRLGADVRTIGRRRKRPNGGYPRTPARASRRHPTRPPNRPACPGPSPDRPQLTRTPAAAA